ncbi:MAG: metallopeptidase family protein [Ruminococcus sp.]|uniref:metallopeptidase family protein n=1 Tax=Ruminococcus sp. TaxID=41978 RepID=UPI003867E515|nr:metallopeptidase family protein [Ruminococcus sp.]MBQ1898588.1 metallopeptidase family protein [Ruminococcus sp.]MBQ4238140.1 metallopeptidase family protein [Ruminococcus sp.]
MTYEECGAILDEIAETLPKDLYRELNGGIVLEDGFRYHWYAQNNDLYILGVYVRDNLGKSIKIYYGSIVRVYRNKTLDEYREILRRVLVHELKHHNEYLAGADDLEYYDDEQICKYLESKGYTIK